MYKLFFGKSIDVRTYACYYKRVVNNSTEKGTLIMKTMTGTEVKKQLRKIERDLDATINKVTVSFGTVEMDDEAFVSINIYYKDKWNNPEFTSFEAIVTDSEDEAEKKAEKIFATINNDGYWYGKAEYSGWENA